MYTPPRIERFNHQVRLRYHVYSNLLQNLPFHQIDKTSVILSMFSRFCEQEFAKKANPQEIIYQFFEKHFPEMNENERNNVLFQLIQYVERQIVLFDAIEDAAFGVVNNMEGRGSIRNLKEKAEQKGKQAELVQFLKDFQLRLVLTAHPTQFYPGPVLGIITDLTEAIQQNDLVRVKDLLAQLGKTPFIKKQKPAPIEEAVSLIWYLENVFYDTIGKLLQYIQTNIDPSFTIQSPVVQIGFWPGGDRDGNPFVTHETSREVANKLRTSVLKCYYQDIRKLKRKLTFKEVDTLVVEIEQQLYRSVFYSRGELYITYQELLDKLLKIRSLLVKNHQGLYLSEVDNLLLKVQTFGFHFAILDIRQNAKIQENVFAEILEKEAHQFPENFQQFSEKDRITWLLEHQVDITNPEYSDDAKEFFATLQTIQHIQQNNGVSGCHRYIISNNQTALQVIQALVLFQWCKVEVSHLDIVPLFESIDDLQGCDQVMTMLYQQPLYRRHLEQRNHQQHIMLGFSDGTKDGGYLMANWSIYHAKYMLTKVSRDYGIQAIFFDGRGGPPARGGGKTHKFYASLGTEIESKQIQLTIQGQTISSNFGIPESCQYNVENLLSAGANSIIFDAKIHVLSAEQKALINEMALKSYDKYKDFKANPKFIDYLEQMSPLNYYAKTNIGSRPAKRRTSEKLEFSQLRAIPFVGAWSMLKQNVPGFYGLGTALGFMEANNRWSEVEHLYQNSLFFKTLMENAMMAMAKSYFPLTQYMQNDPEFGDFWSNIYQEYQESKRLLLKLSGYQELMQNYPDGKASVEMREQIVLPLITIQQFALMQIQDLKKQGKDASDYEVYEKMVIRSLFGNINASRNSA
jgi:phosphoenolpyruvate carboxylase